MFKAFLVGLYHRILLSYKSTLLGLLVAILAETLAYLGNANGVPPYVHAAIGLIMVPFLAWKDKAVADGTIKMLVILVLALSTQACVAGWKAAFSASPACYGLTAADVSAAEAEIKTCVTDLSAANPVGCAEQAITNYQLDKEMADCVYQTTANEIKSPQGGEAAYSPDAGAPDASSPLQAALSLNKQQTSALELIGQLRARNLRR